jgi:hypothetical protein
LKVSISASCRMAIAASLGLSLCLSRWRGWVRPPLSGERTSVLS